MLHLTYLKCITLLFCLLYTSIIILALLLSMFYVGLPNDSYHFFKKKFDGGYFEGVGTIINVSKLTDCTNVELEPTSQAVNARLQKGTKRYYCEFLYEVPERIEAEEFTIEKGAYYYEYFYNDEPVPTECIFDDNLCENGAGCHSWVVRSCADQNISNCSLVEQVYCTSKHVTAMTWDAAKETCNSFGGQLAEDRGQLQHITLVYLLRDLSETVRYRGPVTWIGGYGVWTGTETDYNKTWYWQDGSDIGNVTWGPFNPYNLEDRSCISMNNEVSLRGTWVEKDCNHTAPFICEHWTKTHY